MKGKKGLEQSFLVCAKLSVATLLLVLVFLAELMAGSEKIVEELKLTDWALVCEQVGNRSDCRIEQSMAITPGRRVAQSVGQLRFWDDLTYFLDACTVRNSSTQTSASGHQPNDLASGIGFFVDHLA